MYWLWVLLVLTDDVTIGTSVDKAEFKDVLLVDSGFTIIEELLTGSNTSSSVMFWIFGAGIFSSLPMKFPWTSFSGVLVDLKISKQI